MKGVQRSRLTIFIEDPIFRRNKRVILSKKEKRAIFLGGYNAVCIDSIKFIHLLFPLFYVWQ